VDISADQLKKARRNGRRRTTSPIWADAYRHTPHGQPVELVAKE